MSERKNYKVIATPDTNPKFFSIEIKGLPDGMVGVTQAESREEIPVMARDCIALLLDVPEGSFDIHLDIKEPQP